MISSRLIQQFTANIVINWKGFSVGANELVRFLQPGAMSVAVNTVTGGSASAILGQITAETGSTWTVRARNGQLYTVTITDATKFGTTKHPAARDQFKVGSQARVIGTISGTTITAAQIRLPRAAS